MLTFLSEKNKTGVRRRVNSGSDHMLNLNYVGDIQVVAFSRQLEIEV